MASPASAPPGTILQDTLWQAGFLEDAGNNDAARNRRARIGLWTTALPKASAAAIERTESTSGKLNGEMTPTTPSGTRWGIIGAMSIAGSIIPIGAVRDWRRGG